MQSINKPTVLIFHRIPYDKILYHNIIDHELYSVIYIIFDNNKSDIPVQVPHSLMRVSSQNAVEEIICRTLENNFTVASVMALSEYNLIAAQLVRSALGINNLDSKVVYMCRDKNLMKKALLNTSLQFAQGLLVKSLEELKKVSLPFDKLIIKPVRGASSENTVILESIDEVNDQEQIVDLLKRGKSFIVEEFIKGSIYHFDGLVNNGKIIFAISSKYHGSCLDFVSGQPLASSQLFNQDTYLCWVKRCVEAIGIQNGAFHLEGIMSKDGLYFLEIGNRAGGAGVVKCLHQLLNLNLMQEEVKIYLNAKKYQQPEISIGAQRYGWFVIPNAGIKNKKKLSQRLNTISNLIEYDLNLHPKESEAISYDSQQNVCVGIFTYKDKSERDDVISESYDAFYS